MQINAFVVNYILITQNSYSKLKTKKDISKTADNTAAYIKINKKIKSTQKYII